MAQSKFIQNVVKMLQKVDQNLLNGIVIKLKNLVSHGAMDLIRDGKQSRTPHYGRINMFFYDPKGRKTLPYYDTFPLSITNRKYPDGFLGINFHYLPMTFKIKVIRSHSRF